MASAMMRGMSAEQRRNAADLRAGVVDLPDDLDP
jgi:hypothetical protein